MSLLIKGMEMPSFGNETIIRIQSGGGILDQYGHHLNCEAVPVPPHGRCIDADALEDNNITYYAIPVLANVTDGTIREAELVIRLKDLDDAPTIIEAEED